MKKLIQITAVLSLVFVFSVVAANAQSAEKSYDANVPFEFNVGDKTLPAGKYVITISPVFGNVKRMTIEDEKKIPLQTILVADSGDVAKDAPQLVFNRYGNQRFLSKFVTPQRGVVVNMSRTEKEAARKQRESKPVVAVKIGK